MRFTPRTTSAAVAAALTLLALTACTPANGERTQPVSVSVEDAPPEPVEHYVSECAPAGQASDTPPEPVANYDNNTAIGNC